MNLEPESDWKNSCNLVISAFLHCIVFSPPPPPLVSQGRRQRCCRCTRSRAGRAATWPSSTQRGPSSRPCATSFSRVWTSAGSIPKYFEPRVMIWPPILEHRRSTEVNFCVVVQLICRQTSWNQLNNNLKIDFGAPKSGDRPCFIWKDVLKTHWIYLPEKIDCSKRQKLPI